jgi:hypothetical protein
MKTITIAVADDIYQRASQKAAAAETSLPNVVQNLLCEWTQGEPRPAKAGTEDRRADKFLKFLDELEARPLKFGPSVGPLNREELYERGIPGY